MSSQYLRETMNKISKASLSEDMDDLQALRWVVMIPEGWEEPQNPPGMPGERSFDQGFGSYRTGYFWKGGGHTPNSWADNLQEAYLFTSQKGARAQATQFNNWLKSRAKRRGDEAIGYAEVRRVALTLV
jgi:hypothetical protein